MTSNLHFLATDTVNPYLKKILANYDLGACNTTNFGLVAKISRTLKLGITRIINDIGG